MDQLRKKSIMMVMVLGLLLTTACSNETNSKQNNENNNQEENENMEESNQQEDREEAEENNRQEDDEEEREEVEPEEEMGANDPDEGEIEKAFETLTFSVLKNEEEIGTFEVDVTNPESTYEMKDGTEVEMLRYFPDYVMVDGKPESQSNFPINPAFIFKVGKGEASDTMFVGIGGTVAPEDDPLFTVEIIDFTRRDQFDRTI